MKEESLIDRIKELEKEVRRLKTSQSTMPNGFGTNTISMGEMTDISADHMDDESALLINQILAGEELYTKSDDIVDNITRLNQENTDLKIKLRNLNNILHKDF